MPASSDTSERAAPPPPESSSVATILPAASNLDQRITAPATGSFNADPGWFRERKQTDIGVAAQHKRHLLLVGFRSGDV